LGESSHEDEIYKVKSAAYQAGELDLESIDVDVPLRNNNSDKNAVPDMINPAAMFEQLQKASERAERGKKSERRRLTVGEAKVLLEETELDKLIGITHVAIEHTYIDMCVCVR
jgi:ATP-dependent protease HslVU (ClpYQ) ATPase subunit